MSEDRYFTEFPEPAQAPKRPKPATQIPPEKTAQDNRPSLWENVAQVGLGDISMRLGTHVLLIALILIVAWGMRLFYRSAQIDSSNSNQAAMAAPLPTPTPTPLPPVLPPFTGSSASLAGVGRIAQLHTTLPTLPRTAVSIYTVVSGDTLFDIAEKFGLDPETILWGNQLVLGDNPHNLRPGQELNILPTNGTYYRWQAGDGLNGVSKFFGVDPETIINYPGNHLNAAEIGDYSNPNIEPGTWLIVPGGRREFVTWSAPAIPRDNPGVARVLGPGACSSVVSGAVGIGSFIWPANNHFLSGFDYSPNTNHFGVDIDGETGDPIYATDNGVVVYAGWNDWGYGNVVVINHGNGWQTLYAHLNTYNVGCGQSVFQGSVIAAMGSTGNSTGSHLHYEMMYEGTKVNPWNYLP